jgi:hypothetical protein
MKIIKKQCSNPKCRQGKITQGEGAKLDFGVGAVMVCFSCGADFEEVEEFLEPEDGN